MKIAQYVETFSYVGMFNTMNFASYICLYLISPFMQHPVYRVNGRHGFYPLISDRVQESPIKRNKGNLVVRGVLCLPWPWQTDFSA